jgi:paired small multidrug resistance pump
MSHQIFNAIGLLGVLITLLAYVLLQTGKIKSAYGNYALYNLIGSLLILVSLYDKFNLPATIMEITWSLASIYGLIKAIKLDKT